MSLENLPLDLDGEVTEPALLPLPVEAVQHGGLGAGEAHLHHGPRGGGAAGPGAAGAARISRQGLHLGIEINLQPHVNS